MIEIRIVIEGLSELTEAVKGLAGGRMVQNTTAIQPGSAPVQPSAPAQQDPMAQQGTSMQPSVPVRQNALVQPNPMMQQGIPAPQSALMQAGMPGQQVPTTAAAQEYTLEQLQVAAAGLTSSGKMPQVMAILQQFGIQAMTELRKEQYGAFATALRGAGAQI